MDDNVFEGCNARSPSYKDAMDYANGIIRKLNPVYIKMADPVYIHPATQKLRWFLLPSEAIDMLQNPRHHGIKSPRPFHASKTQFKTKSLERVKSKTYEGSVLDQVLDSVWANQKHPLTEELVAEDSRVRNASLSRRHARESEDFSSSTCSSSSGDISPVSSTRGNDSIRVIYFTKDLFCQVMQKRFLKGKEV